MPETDLEPQRREGGLLREIILEDFMSYEYARIPLKPGLNLICGPNGSGKSSILLALAVALGQAYTERSRRLSDLIRRGKKLARVTLIFDNRAVGGRRRLPGSDQLRLSRYLRSDGAYWYEVDYRAATKAEVVRMLEGLGLNPNNLLIIMHQNMVEEFAVIQASERLRLVEEAVGFQAYRQNVLEARDRLTKLQSEEEAVSGLLANAEQTLEHWRREWEKLQKRRRLLARKAELELELAWSQVIRRERSLQAAAEAVKRKSGRLEALRGELERLKGEISTHGARLNSAKMEHRKAFYTLLTLERESAEAGASAALIREFVERAASLGASESNGAPMGTYLGELKGRLESLASRGSELKGEVSRAQSGLAEWEREVDRLQDEHVELRVKLGELDLRAEFLEREVDAERREVKRLEEEIAQFTAEALKVGGRVETHRAPAEVSDDLKLTLAHLASLGEASEDAERMYRTYLGLYNELKAKAQVVAENRSQALKEVQARMETWHRAVGGLLDEVSRRYQELLSLIGAAGSVRLTNPGDIEQAGLELAVGFRGAQPVALDPYTQSGGERTTAIMAFLIALQQHVRSPLRAVDEFDIHMDPRNRELIARLIVASVRERAGQQYLVITPGQIPPLEDEGVHVITVQNAGGRSQVGIGV